MRFIAPIALEKLGSFADHPLRRHANACSYRTRAAFSPRNAAPLSSRSEFSMNAPRPSSVKLEKIWGRAAEPVFVLSANLKIVYVNQAWRTTTGFASEQVVGLNCSPGPIDASTSPVDLLARRLSPPPETLAGRPASKSTLVPNASVEPSAKIIEYLPFHDKETGKLLYIVCLIRDPEGVFLAGETWTDRVRVELDAIRARIAQNPKLDELIGRGPAHARLLAQIRAAADSRSPLLIVGEPGTGKRSVARAVHRLGSTPSDALITFDSATTPGDRLIAELFRSDPRSGRTRWNFADQSTLLFTSVDALDRDAQAGVLPLLAEPELVRVIATTSADPFALRREKKLRDDFYYAITVQTIALVPLRERFDEIPLLSRYFLEKINERGRKHLSGFTERALEALSSYDWPGNLGELKRVIEYSYDKAKGDRIDREDFPPIVRGDRSAHYVPLSSAEKLDPPLDEFLGLIERRLIEYALERGGRNKSKAAEYLGVSRPRLYRRIDELKIADSRDEPPPPNLES